MLLLPHLPVIILYTIESSRKTYRVNLICKTLLLTGFLAIPFLGNSQFSYYGVGVALRSTTFHKPEISPGEKTKTKTTVFQVNGLYRPLRFLGLGATLSIPIKQSSTFSFSDAETNTRNPFEEFGMSGDYSSNDNSAFIPETFDYTIEQSISVTLKTRLYAFIKSGLYFDLRFSIMSLTESLVIERDLQEGVPPIDINQVEKIGLFIPGFGVGLQENIGKRLYIDFSANFDFMNIKNKGFSEKVVYNGSNTELYTVIFEDQISGSKSSTVLQISLGYTF